MKFTTTLVATCLSTGSTLASALVIPRTHPSLAGVAHAVKAGGGSEAVAEHTGNIVNFISTQQQSTQDRRDLALDARENLEALDARTHFSLSGAAHAVKAAHRFSKHVVKAGGGGEAVAEHAGEVANFVSNQRQSKQEESPERRDIEVYAREKFVEDLDARDFEEEVDAREILDEGLDIRDFMEDEFNARSFDEELDARNFAEEDLHARENIKDEFNAREFWEELDARDFEIDYLD